MKRLLVLVAALASSCAGLEPPPAVPSLTTALAPSGTLAGADLPAPTAGPPAPHLDRAFLEAYSKTRSFRLGAPQRMRPTPDGRSVLFLRSGPRDPKQSLYELDLATGSAKELLAPEALVKAPETLSAAERARRERMRVTARGFTAFDLSEDGADVLLTLSGRLFVLTRASGRTRELATGAGAVTDPHFSPDGKLVGYVRANDVHVVGARGDAESAVTRGGTEQRTHGSAEFIAQEELGRTRGFWFSPDGTKVAYEEADTAKVEVLTISDPSHPEREPERNAYPRAGRSNAELRFGITSSRGGATTWIAWDHARYPYVASVTWSKGAPLTLYVTDRLQKSCALLAVDDVTGKTTTLLEERDDAWVNVDHETPRWLPDGRGFVWSTERRGAWQLELRDAKGALVRELTPVTFGYHGLAHVDAKRREAWLYASEEPTEARLYAVSLDGGAPRLVRGTPGQEVSAAFVAGSDAYVTTERSLAATPRFLAHGAGGAREIPSAMETPPFMPQVELAKVGPDHTRVAIVRPRSFVRGVRYPMIDAAYGGPGVNLVVSDAMQFLRQQWMADATGAIVVTLDARGTPRRGRDWERALSGKAAKVPLEGHVEALRALGAAYPEMDVTRVGVYGWSYGGYFAGLAVLARPDFYKVGVAGAPVVDWRDYDTCYTERYLGLPDANAAAYDEASLLTYAAKPAAARPLLIVHGTADDNVYFLHSLRLVDALERARKPFELMPLAGVTHQLAQPEMAELTWTRTAEFLRAGLLL